MSWVAVAAVAAPVVMNALSGGSGGGGGGPRGVNLTSAQSDPWNLQARQKSLDYQEQQGAFVNEVQQNAGIGNQGNIFNQQQQLANQLQAQANGQGPNPAQAMLANTTGQNASQQAALMGSQRGSSGNVGLMARQAGMQGGAIQQQAAGQGAALMAQQQIAAQQNLMQQQGQMGNLAGNMVNQGLQGGQGQIGALQNQQAMQLQSLANWNSVNASASNGSQAANAEFAKMGQQQQGAMAQGGGSMLSVAGKYNGGTIQNYANGGKVQPSSKFGQKCHGMMMKTGGDVPGHAQVKGNSPKNDTVPAMLSPGEVVIDRETLNSKGKEGQAARFLKAYLAKKNRSK